MRFTSKFKSPADCATNRNQKGLPNAIRDALSELSGNDWGQYGDLVFFAQIACRNQEGIIKSFQYV